MGECNPLHGMNSSNLQLSPSILSKSAFPIIFLRTKHFVKVEVAQSCPTFGDPMAYTVHGILQARILEWVVLPFSRGSSQPRKSILSWFNWWYLYSNKPVLKTQNETKFLKWKSFSNIWYNIKHSNISVIGISERKRGKMSRKSIWKIWLKMS